MEPAPPLIVTLKLDADSRDYFNNLRQKYFPAHVNYLDAHLTLFHHLPSTLESIDSVLSGFANRADFTLSVTDIKNMGNGVAFEITSPELMDVHSALQQAFRGHLISQDRHRIWPHITVQNKVTAFKAKQTAEFLSSAFTPFSIQATGFETWLYLKGPWQHVKDYLFQEKMQ